MRKLIFGLWALCFVWIALGQQPIQRNSFTVNNPGQTPASVPAPPGGFAGFVVVHVAGDGTIYASPNIRVIGTNTVFTGGVSAPDLTITNSVVLSNVTIYGTLTVISNMVVQGSGPGGIYLYDITGTNATLISAPTNYAFTGTNTWFIPTSIGPTNSVLQMGPGGQSEWRTNMTLPGDITLNGPGVGAFTFYDSTGTNFVTLTVSNVLGGSFTNYLPITAGGETIWAQVTDGNGNIVVYPSNVLSRIVINTDPTNYASIGGSILVNDDSHNFPVVIVSGNASKPISTFLSSADIAFRNGGGTPVFELYSYGTTTPITAFALGGNTGYGSLVTLDPFADIGPLPFRFNTDTGNVLSASAKLVAFGNANTNVAYVAGDGSLWPRGVTNIWPSANANGTLLNDGSGNLTWTGPTSSGGGDTTATNIVTLTQTGTNVSQLDFSLVERGGIFKLSLTNNAFIGTPTNVSNTIFRKAWLMVQQPSTGTCLVTFTNGTFAFPEGATPINDTNNGSVSIYEFVTDVFTNGLVHGSLTPLSKLIQ